MIKWKSTRQSKHKTSAASQKTDCPDTKQTTQTEYHETLYSQERTSKKEKNQWSQQRWENAETIEKHVDQLKQTTASSSACSSGYDMNQKIDLILAKKKKKM